MATRYPLVISGTQIQELQTGDTLLGSVANITGGSAGQLPYQSGANTTGFTAAGTSGQYLQSTGAGAPTWATINALPAQTSNSGKYLTTDGTTASWGTVSALPTQTSNSGKYLTTDGTTASWGTVSAGKLLQVVTSRPSDAQSSSQTLATFATLAITPTSATSKIIFTFSGFFNGGGTGVQMKGGAIALYNQTQSTTLVSPGGVDSAGYSQLYGTDSLPNGFSLPFSITTTDLPASTAAQTYQVQFAARGGSPLNLPLTRCQIVLMEVAP